MSNTQDIIAAGVSLVKTVDIPSLIVPIANRELLLPTVSVAEMLPFIKPQLRPTGLPSWFLGNVHWRGVVVPMFSYELISGELPLPIKKTSQMAILNSTGISRSLPFLCFPTQGIPRLSRVSPDSIIEEKQTSLQAFDQLNVVINDDRVAIPDVSKIEQTLVELLHL
ncbi:MAG: chemosensory pili system protein ChpC [Candidatus Endobugula sp.]|jgi:chemosensory pili system protein ChpC